MSEYSYPLFDENGKVICQVCGKSFLVISPMHLRGHNIKYDEYKLRFPDAPLSSEEFIATSKYGKEKLLFVETEMDKFDEDSPLPDEDMEEIIVGEDPTVEEEIDLTLVLKEEERKNLDPMSVVKNKILDHLRIFFTNVEKDYLIEQYGTDNRLKFQFITDFCDPILKIVIQFPKTFWHNREIADDPNKKIKLESYKWKVIEIDGVNPSLKKITNKIESL